MQFRSTIQPDGRTATGIPVPDHIVAALDGGNRPRVRVTVAGYSYQTTIARMRGEFKFPVSAAVRDQAGVAAGDEIDVELELDTQPRELIIPTDLARAFEEHPVAKTLKLAPGAPGSRPCRARVCPSQMTGDQPAQLASPGARQERRRRDAVASQVALRARARRTRTTRRAMYASSSAPRAIARYVL
jgi:hypothetical protein